MSAYEPKIVMFCCNWCHSAGADVGEIAKASAIPSLKVVKTMCSGGVSPTYILRAFKSGADGVMVVGCPLGDCHYMSGNYKARRRVKLMKRVLDQFGIEPERLSIELVSESDADKFRSALSKFVGRVSRMGALRGSTAGVN